MNENLRESVRPDETVLVTGGSGFIGVHCILRLLQAGYHVRTTVRSLERAEDVREMVRAGGAEPGEAVSFVAADLTSDAGWAEAVDGAFAVLHVASPFPAQMPQDANELILPAREGALRVLRAARDARVPRVVMTSSFAAIGYGHGPREGPFSEKDWTQRDPTVSAYVKSKTLAERAAWDFVAGEDGALELSVVNPVGVLGPALGPDLSTSVALVKRLMDGSMSRAPHLYFNVVDVRDVADLHLRAMIDPAAAGERFLAAAGDPVSLPEIAALLKSRMGDAAARVPTRPMPDWMVRAAALVDPEAKRIAPDLGKVRKVTNEKARRVLGWSPRSNEEAIIATAQSLVDLGLLREQAVPA
jgi:nucleoside-diphosphate-sugar epimerase